MIRSLAFFQKLRSLSSPDIYYIYIVEAEHACTCNMNCKGCARFIMKDPVSEKQTSAVQGKGEIVAPVLECARACIIGMRNLLTPSAWKHVSSVALLDSDVKHAAT